MKNQCEGGRCGHFLVLSACGLFVTKFSSTEVFLDKDVRETRRRERGNARGGATNKRQISRTSLSINPKILRTSYMEAPFESDNPSLRGEETKRVLSFVFHCFKILHKSLT